MSEESSEIEETVPKEAAPLNSDDIKREGDKIYFYNNGDKELIYDANFNPDFSGIPDLKDIKGSALLNNKEDNFQPFCYDEEGVIYYVSPNDGQYVYSYDGAVHKRISDIPGNCLNYCNGSVYFLSNGSMIRPIDGIWDFYGYL